MRLPPKKERRVEKRFVDGIEKDVEVEVELPMSPMKRLFLFPGKEVRWPYSGICSCLIVASHSPIPQLRYPQYPSPGLCYHCICYEHNPPNDRVPELRAWRPLLRHELFLFIPLTVRPHHLSSSRLSIRTHSFSSSHTICFTHIKMLHSIFLSRDYRRGCRLSSFVLLYYTLNIIRIPSI